MAIKAVVASGIATLFNQLQDLVEVAVVQRRRGTAAAVETEPAPVASGYNPRTGFNRGSRNFPRQETRDTDPDEKVATFPALADLNPFPTAASGVELQGSPDGVIRYAVNALALTPKASLMDVLNGGRKADLEALFEVNKLPMLEGKRFLPATKDLIRVNDNIYNIDMVELDPTRSILTAKLMSANEGGEVANA